MTAIHGSTAVVTGAAQGIGRALALELAQRGCDVALADRDEAGMRDVAQAISAVSTANVSIHKVDMGDAGQIEAMAADIIARHPKLNIVINNAGVALVGQFHEVSKADMEWLMNINFWGVVNATRAFLPHLETQPAAHIANTSSIFGIKMFSMSSCQTHGPSIWHWSQPRHGCVSLLAASKVKTSWPACVAPFVKRSAR